MVGVALKVDSNLHFKKYISNLQKFNKHVLLDAIGGLVQSQTEHRIKSEKTSPSGQAWAPRKKYATHPLLEHTHRLMGSLNYQVKSNSVEVGSNLKYAATHQYGDERTITRKTKNGRSKSFSRGIPARAYLGLSSANEKAVEALMLLYMNELNK